MPNKETEWQLEEVLKEIDKMLKNIERNDEIDEKSKYEAYCFDTI